MNTKQLGATDFLRQFTGQPATHTLRSPLVTHPKVTKVFVFPTVLRKPLTECHLLSLNKTTDKSLV